MTPLLNGRTLIGLRNLTIATMVCLFSPTSLALDVQVGLAGKVETVVAPEQFNCSKPRARDLADIPASAYRTSDGEVILFAGNRTGFVFRGPTLDLVARKDCSSVNPSDGNPDPSEYRDQEWTTAFFSFNGRDVAAYVHNEYHGEMHGEDCHIVLTRNRECWYASSTLMHSSDGGKTFKVGDPEDSVIMGPSYRYKTGMRRVGTYMPKVVGGRDGKSVFVFVSRVDINRNLRIGQCLLRSDKNQRQWALWADGKFRPAPRSPYTSDGADGKFEHCSPVMMGNVLSIKFMPSIDAYIAVGANRKTGVYVQLSKDLVKWGPRHKISGIDLDSATASTLKRGEYVHRRWYFSLLDPTSTSRNFDTIGKRPYLYFVEFGDGQRRQKSIRTIKRVPLAISPF
ncbi:MAG: hypothetical protein OER56_13185 [Hyphomicrobiales bacterium]|nr:hypothetical protein [Hyphomicrobiales bacterium]